MPASFTDPTAPSGQSGRRAAHPDGVTTQTSARTRPARKNRAPQYPHLEERLHHLAHLATSGDMGETEARRQALQAVWETDLAEATVLHWLDAHLWHLRDELVFEAQAWLIRAITGQSVGEYMSKLEDPATLLDFRRVASGASAVGYLRQGLVRDRSKFLRTVIRHRGADRSVLVDAAALTTNAAPGRILDEGHRYEARSVSDAVATPAPAGDVRADLLLDRFLGQRRRAPEADVLQSQAQALRDYYNLPHLNRPLDGDTRDAMCRILRRDAGAAHYALGSAAAGATGGMAWLWSTYTRDDIETLSASVRADESIRVLALAAVSRYAWPGRVAARRVRGQVGRLFVRHGLPAGKGRKVALAFLADECEPPPVASAESQEAPPVADWAELALPFTGEGGVLGPDLHAARQLLTGLLTPANVSQNAPGAAA